MTITDLPDEPIRVLVSSCLLGEKVRYDGGHKRDPLLVETLGRFVEVVPVCPEVECGLPTPREAMRLAGDPADPRLVTLITGVDHTGKMQGWIRRKLKALEGLDLCGYICKKGSPSSGMDGLFTKAFIDHFPLIPVEEEDRLQDPVLREMFVERVFTLRRLRERIRKGKSLGNLVEFHTDHKFLILTHGRARYAEMGKLVAHAKELPLEELYRRYQHLLMEALRLRTTPAKCADVLMHVVGHIRQLLTSDEKQELLELIGRYRNRLIPLVVPVTLIRHYARKYDVACLKRQAFLNPHPVELMLRNHV